MEDRGLSAWQNCIKVWSVLFPGPVTAVESPRTLMGSQAKKWVLLEMKSTSFSRNKNNWKSRIIQPIKLWWQSQHPAPQGWVADPKICTRITPTSPYEYVVVWPAFTRSRDRDYSRYGSLESQLRHHLLVVPATIPGLEGCHLIPQKGPKPRVWGSFLAKARHNPRSSKRRI